MAVATVRRILHRSMRRLHLCIAGYLANLSRLTSNCCQHQMIKWLKHWMKVTCPRPILSYSHERLCWLLIKADWGSSSASFCKVGSGLLLGLPSSSAFSCNAQAPPEACWQQAKARMGNEVPSWAASNKDKKIQNSCHSSTPGRSSSSRVFGRELLVCEQNLASCPSCRKLWKVTPRTFGL